MDDELRSIIEVASRAVNVDFSLYREPMLQRRVAHRMLLCGISSAAEYASHLRDDPSERWRLADAFLIKTTSAFRDARTWKALCERALPGLIERCVLRGCAALSVWVVGCSTGEEAYSYAMVMLDARERAAVQLDVQVFATDVDVSALEHATRGEYASRAFAATPPALAERFLRKGASGESIVGEELRRAVSFARHDITGATPIPQSVFASFDVVSCCNVLLYLGAAARQRAFSRLLLACEQRGLLVLGEAEYPPRDLQASLTPIAEGARAFEVTAEARLTSPGT